MINARETRLELATSSVTGWCSNRLNYSRNRIFGRKRTRTYDRLCVRQELYQLSYTPGIVFLLYLLVRFISIESFQRELKKSFRNALYSFQNGGDR